MIIADIINRIQHDTIDSNCVYPLGQDFLYITRLDNDWVREKLEMEFGHGVTRINNKYAIRVPSNNGKDIAIVNHDGEHWLIDKA